MRKLLLAALFLGLGSVPLFSEGQKPKEPPAAILQSLDQPVFVVTHNHFAQGNEPDSAKIGDLLMIEIIPAANNSEGLEDYEMGKDYQLFKGGESQGSVRIKRIVGLQCDSHAAVVKPGLSVKIPKDGFALATRSKTVKSHPAHVSVLSAEEKQKVLKLVAAEFKKRKVKVESLSKIRTENLKKIQLESDAFQSIVGNFYLKTGETLDGLFLILEPEGGTFRPTLLHYHHNDSDEGFEDETFADQIDLGGDGKDEIVTQVEGYESEAFFVYERTEKGWKKIWEGGGGGC